MRKEFFPHKNCDFYLFRCSIVLISCIDNCVCVYNFIVQKICYLLHFLYNLMMYFGILYMVLQLVSSLHAYILPQYVNILLWPWIDCKWMIRDKNPLLLQSAMM